MFLGNGIVKNSRVAEAMLTVDRGHYSKNNPYMDSPQGIGYAVTISAPHMVRSPSRALLAFIYDTKLERFKYLY